jgi:hypothetical protein
MRAPRTAISLLAALGLLAAALGAPGVASAQLVFDRGNDIWAANDDGSNPHPLVAAAPLGMDAGLGSPAVAPDGDTLLFVGTTKRNQIAGHSQDFYGENAAGTYALQGGVVRRLSPPPVASPSSWTTLTDEPEPAPGGSYVYKYRTCTETPVLFEYAFFWNPFCKNELRSAGLAAGDAGSTQFATPCDTDGEGGPAGPSPDPANGSLLVAYVGCTVEAGGGGMARPALIVSGAGEAGEKAAAEGAELPYSTEALADPSWSPDGSRLVLYDHGGTTIGGEPEDSPGIYVLEPMPNPTSSRLLVSAPEEAEGVFETLASPRFVGANTIAFVAGGSVWSLPVSCDECTMADATKLFDGRSDPSTQAFSVAWTARGVAPAAVYPGQGGGSSSGEQSGASPSSSSSPASRPGAHRHNGQGGHGGTLALSLGAVHAPPLRKLLAKGLPVKVRCSRACGLTLSLTVDAKTARRYRLLSSGGSRRRSALLRRHRTAVAVGRTRIELRAGKPTGVRVRFTHEARRVLRRAHGLKLRLVAVARAAGLAPASAARIVKVHR